MKDITHDEIRRLLDYEPETGRFFWRVNRRPSIKAGDEAGHRSVRPHHDRWVVKVGGQRYLRARLAWFWMMGNWPLLHVDHADGDSMNDRWNNLREATHSQNLANAAKPKSGKTPLKGAYLKNGKFVSQIGYGGEHIHLGTFETAEEAHAAYMNAAQKFYGEFARAT